MIERTVEGRAGTLKVVCIAGLHAMEAIIVEHPFVLRRRLNVRI